MAKAAKIEQRPQHICVNNDTVAILELSRSILEDEGFQVTTDGFSIEGVAGNEPGRCCQPVLIRVQRPGG